VRVSDAAVGQILSYSHPVLLENYAVRGFRSLHDVAGIPVGKPTILAGQNDGGKTSALHALAFLLNRYAATEADLTCVPGEPADAPQTMSVEGQFRTDEWERTTFDLGETVRLRRVFEPGQGDHFEHWSDLADDEDLRNLPAKTVPALKALLTKYDLSAERQTKPFLLQALEEYAGKHSSTTDWVPTPAALVRRLPRITWFDGRTLEPEGAIRSVLDLKLKDHIAGDAVRKKVRELEEDLEEWVRIEAKPLEDHIVGRCDDIETVSIAPTVTATPVLKETKLQLQRPSGELVQLDRSGMGSARRVSMAIWEATSDVLAEQAETAADEAPALPVVVVYDEPDTHLDYHFQRNIMKVIRSQSKLDHVSVVVATHSMNLIDGVDIRDVVLLRLDEQRQLTVVERLGSGDHADFDRHLGRIATAVGLRNSVLLHERCFFAVEGETELQAMPLLFQLSEGLSLQAAGIALWACGGNDGALSLARYLYTHGRAVLLVVDADSRSQNRMFRDQRLRQTFDAHYEEHVVLLGEAQRANELEELFSDEQWARVANAEWPRAGDWSPEHFAEHRCGAKFSGDVEKMLRDHSTTESAGKPGMMVAMASSLSDPEEVPPALRAVFRRLQELAG
jgi:putative ATP-dependent endonuclease of OLD family